ncbi:MAG TPA: SRPBCC family protein [Candidatus Polarisedimenticolia bacterium]|nr:SRPBCC family protein [Candidatus Polarisedimenticolia bacterium]
MPHIEDTIEIDRPIEEVWAYITDWFNAPRVSGSGIIGLRQTSPGPLTVGSTLQGRRVVLGFETRNDFVVTEWDPPHVMTSTATGRPFRSLVSRITLEPTASGTRLVSVTDFELQLAMKVIWPLMAPVVMRRLRASGALIKGLIEGRPR